MNEADQKTFLEKILTDRGLLGLPNGDSEIEVLTTKIIQQLPQNETYRFIVVAKHPEYKAPEADPSDFPDRKSWRQYLIDEKQKFVAEHQAPLREYFEAMGVNYPDVKMGFIFPVELTKEQAQQIKSCDLVARIIADLPVVI